jgi:hypothetical protein
MIEGAELDLLIDLARMLKKHGPGTFQSLATWISSPNNTKELITIVNHAAEIANKILVKTQAAKKTVTKSRTVTKKKVGKAKVRTPKALRFLERTEPEKYKILKDFHARLLRRGILPELKDIREFAGANGLKDLKGDSREKLVNPLVNALANLTIEQLKQAVERGKSHSTMAEDSLEDWTAVILERSRENRERLAKE